MREPWFRILDVWEPKGRSMADIADEIINRSQVIHREVFGPSRTRTVTAVRIKIIRAIRRERPDLDSERVGSFMRRDSSLVRHYWRGLAA